MDTNGLRLQTLEALKHRLKPGSPLVVAHHSVPQANGEKLRWLQRYAAFAVSSGIVWPYTKAAYEPSQGAVCASS